MLSDVCLLLKSESHPAKRSSIQAKCLFCFRELEVVFPKMKMKLNKIDKY